MAENFWFKFYFKDWGDDTKLLSAASKGILIDLIIHLRKNEGVMPIDFRLTQRLSGATTEEVKIAFDEYRSNDIFDFEKSGETEILRSRKITKEIAKSLTNTENGKKGGNPKLKKRLTDSDNRKSNRKPNSIFNSDSKSNNNYSLVFPFESEIFKSNWDAWKVYKKDQHNFTYKKISEQAALKKIGEIAKNESEAILIIHQSIENGWKGFFEIKQNGKQQPTNQSKPTLGRNATDYELAAAVAKLNGVDLDGSQNFTGGNQGE